MNKLNELDLLYNPVQWARNQIESRNREIYDENFRHFQKIGNIYKTYAADFDMAYDILVKHKIINDGDDAPWTKELPK